MKRVILVICLLILIACSLQYPKDMSDRFTVCGMSAKCPEGFTTKLTGGQCLECINKTNNIVYTNWSLCNHNESLKQVACDIPKVLVTANIVSELKNTNYSNPPYSPTLDMNNLTYNGKKVIWVYQFSKETSEDTIKIIPCIMLENKERYCDES